jgi:putative FmdB family regulatory protein
LKYLVLVVERSIPARKRRYRMPTYSFRCRKCGKAFRETLSFKEYEEGKRKCPKCGSGSVVQLLEPFYAKTSRKS